MAAHEIIHPIWSDIVSRTVIVTLLIVTGCAIVGYFAKGEFQRQYWRRFRTMTLLIVVLLVFAYVGGWIFNFLITGLTIAAMWELWRSQYELGRVGIKWTIVGSIATLPTISHYFGITGIFIAICAVATMALVSLSFVHAQVRQQIKIALLGFACIGIPAALIVLIRSEGGFGAMVFFLAVVQLADLGAYLGGRRWGRRKLVATLSPGKTWEGLFCGAMAAVGGALIFAYTLPVWSFAELVIIALILTVIGLLGDLFASYLKRLRRVKDFGSLLPGHGGVIDRFDSYFATAPITWLLLASPLFATLRTNQDSATIFVFLLVTLLSSLTLVAFLVYALDRAIGNRISTEMRPVSRTTR